MTIPIRRVRWLPRATVGAKFFLTVGVLVPAVLAVAGVGAYGLNRMAARSDMLYSRSFAVSQHAGDVVGAASAIHETALYQVAVRDSRQDGQLSTELDEQLIPKMQQAIDVLRADFRGDPADQARVDALTTGLDEYLQLRRSGAFVAADGTSTDATDTALATRTDDIMGPIVEGAEALRAEEARNAEAVKADSDATYLSTRVTLALSVVVVLLLGLAVVLALIRNMLPRIRRYAEFAGDVAAGRPTTLLQPHGSDELTGLGNALNDLVHQRLLVTQAEQAQAEFVDTLQVTRNEDEAQELVRRHLIRALPGSKAVVLRRNNSDNRLQAATAIPAGSALAAALVGAEPRSCVAVRLGRTHREGPGLEPLLGCTVCGNASQPSSCEPLLVGGEVIGSVLVSYPAELTDAPISQVRVTVAQAAPVLANLRSLALAEFRANNDSLTGLPNKRATEDTLKRMVAQASRSVSTLTAIMLDLDHFKAINDQYGHAQGDEVLAAVGTAIASNLRASDFAGRFGGEEFLVLLPETGLDGAWQVAEKIRTAIAAISVVGVGRAITASLGIADLLEHAGNATGLLREADRAQYAAKAGGRNRTVIAVVDDTRAAEQEPSGSDQPSIQPATSTAQ